MSEAGVLRRVADVLRRVADGSWLYYQANPEFPLSQSRVAKMERGDPHVSLDLIIRALLGMTRCGLAQIICGR